MNDSEWHLPALMDHLITGGIIENIKPESVLRQRKVESYANKHHPSTTSPPHKPEEKPRLPGWTPPNLTIKEVRDAIPPHLFERNLLKSFFYVFWDLSWISIMAMGATYIDELSMVFRYILWPLYWFWQGALMTGVWVLAHECGHQAFSDYKWVNNTVGWILHSALLVPFHSWRLTHAQHHRANAHLEKDAVFVPRTRSEYGLPPPSNDEDNDDMNGELWKASPLMNVLNLLRILLLGWPVYLIVNAWGPKAHYGASHFNAKSLLFKPQNYWQIVSSDFGVFIALTAVVAFMYKYGFFTVSKYYLVPYLVVNWWLIMITYLQHTDVTIPHYRDGEFNFIRGALCTVDRSYGILDYFFHHIADTHIAHHLFSQMPHHNAKAATEALKNVLGRYYRKDSTHPFIAMYRAWDQCRFVEDYGDIVWYKNRY